MSDGGKTRVIPRLTVALPICWSVLLVVYVQRVPHWALREALGRTDAIPTLWWVWGVGAVAAAGVGRLLDWLVCRPGPLP